MTLGSRIKAARLRARLTQADIARQFGIKASSVSQWETDETVPELDRLSRLAAILGVSVEYLATDGAALPPPERGHTVDAADMIPNARRVAPGARDLPIRGTAQGGPDGIVTLSEDPIDYTWRPPELMQVKDAFALWVDGAAAGGAALQPAASSSAAAPIAANRITRFTRNSYIIHDPRSSPIAAGRHPPRAAGTSHSLTSNISNAYSCLRHPDGGPMSRSKYMRAPARPAPRAAKPGATTTAPAPAPAVAPLRHRLSYLGWRGGTEDGPAQVRITIETAFEAGRAEKAEAAFDLLTFLDHLLGWEEATLRSVVPVLESDAVATLREIINCSGPTGIHTARALARLALAKAERP